VVAEMVGRFRKNDHFMNIMNSAGRLTDQIEIDRYNSRYDQLLEKARQASSNPKAKTY